MTQGRQGVWMVGLVAMVACRRQVDCEVAELADYQTGLALTVKADEPGSSWVEYTSGDVSLETPKQDGEGAVHELYGLVAGAAVDYVGHFLPDNGREATCEGTADAGALLLGAPTWTVRRLDKDNMSPERFILGGISANPSFLYIVDRFTGEYVWLVQGEPERMSPHIEVAEQDKTDGTGVELLYSIYDAKFTEDISSVQRVTLAGEELENTRTPLGHHTFAQHEDGTLAYPSIDRRQWFDPSEGREITVCGDRLMELTPDGVETEVFTVWDHFEPVRNEDYWASTFFPDCEDWVHANSIRYYPDRGTYLYSGGHMDTAMEIDRASGEPVRVWGTYGDWNVAAGSDPFVFQHSVNYTDSGTLLMSTSYGGRTYPIEYELDDATQTLTQVWSPAKDDGIEAVALGYAERLPNGNTLTSMGAARLLREYDPEGELVWEMEVEVGGNFLGDVKLLDSFWR